MLKAEDLEYIRDRIFDVINSGQANIYDSQKNEELQVVTERYLYPSDDFISLTDVARRFNRENPSYVIQSWLRGRNAIAFLGEWEKENHPNFDEKAFRRLQVDVRSPSYTLTPVRWVERTKAIGITSKRGKYGGTMAHPFIVCDFEMWNDVEFRYRILEIYLKHIKCNRN